MENKKVLIIIVSVVVFLVAGGVLTFVFLIPVKTLDQTVVDQNPVFNPDTTQTTDQKPPVNVPGGRVAAGYVAGHLEIGPNCGGPVVDSKPCPTPPEAYSSREVVVYDSDGVSVNVKGKIDTKGNYKIPLGPGYYFVQIVPAGIGAGEKKGVTIKSWETTNLDFFIDTGIR
jgi:hypothetical protein